MKILQENLSGALLLLLLLHIRPIGIFLKNNNDDDDGGSGDNSNEAGTSESAFGDEHNFADRQLYKLLLHVPLRNVNVNVKKKRNTKMKPQTQMGSSSGTWRVQIALSPQTAAPSLSGRF